MVLGLKGTTSGSQSSFRLVGAGADAVSCDTSRVSGAGTLLEQASKGESFIIAKAGKPVVKVTALSSPTGGEVRRLGFMAGQISVPDDFDQMGREEIERIVGGGV